MTEPKKSWDRIDIAVGARLADEAGAWADRAGREADGAMTCAVTAAMLSVQSLAEHGETAATTRLAERAAVARTAADDARTAAEEARGVANSIPRTPTERAGDLVRLAECLIQARDAARRAENLRTKAARQAGIAVEISKGHREPNDT